MNSHLLLCKQRWQNNLQGSVIQSHCRKYKALKGCFLSEESIFSISLAGQTPANTLGYFKY